jgi:hypothetical protein
MATGITYGDSIARKLGWLQITSIADSKYTNQKKTWANGKSDKVIPSLAPLFNPYGTVYLNSRTATLKWRHFQHRNYVPLLESLLTTRCDGPVNSLACLPDMGGGNNDISKLVDLVAIANMTLFSPNGNWHNLWICHGLENGMDYNYIYCGIKRHQPKIK